MYINVFTGQAEIYWAIGTGGALYFADENALKVSCGGTVKDNLKVFNMSTLCSYIPAHLGSFRLYMNQFESQT